MAVLGAGAPIQLDELDQYRKELTGYCYRMLGSIFEADDAVQETMIKAWKKADTFEGRSSVRSWLYRIATNVCLDQLRGRQRRARPMELGPAGDPDHGPGEVLPEHMWVSPVPDSRVLPDDGDPAELAAARESIRLAFVAALQHLPARQRAALILCEVLKWQATEAAELLDTSVASVNSALQRARATLAGIDTGSVKPISADQQELLAQYVDAFERYDVPKLVTLLHGEVVLSMPPHPLWLVGPDHLAAWFLGSGIGCADSRLIPVDVNGGVGFASYKPDPASGKRLPWAIQIVEVSGDRIVGHHNFLHFGHPQLFEAFGLPDHLD